MSIEEAWDAHDHFDSYYEQNAVAATKSRDKTERQGILKSISDCFIAAGQSVGRLKDIVYHNAACSYVSATQALEEERAFKNTAETTQAEAYLKAKSHVYPDSESEKFSASAKQDFENDYPYNRRIEKSSKKMTMLKKNTIYEDECIMPIDHHHEMYENHDMKTLGDSLAFFDLSSQLQQLEDSLEDVRRNKKNKEAHEECVKKIDREIQKLSFKYHPDKVKNRGGTEEDVTAAQKLQTALNATRTVLKLLNSAFIDDISTDHKFGFYTGLNIDSLCNEDEMQNSIFEVMLEISIISRIKQQNITSEISKFLTESKNCVRSYLDKSTDEFKKHLDLTLFHLRCCLEGFEKLCTELHKLEQKFKLEKHFLFVIEKMANDSKRNLRLLKSLRKTTEASVKGRYRFFNPGEEMDSYFVLPLVWCMNVILMCNVMIREGSIFDFLNNLNREIGPCDNDDFSDLVSPYYLASYCSGNNYHKEKALEILGNSDLEEAEPYGICSMHVSKKNIELIFHEHIKLVAKIMECKFKIEDYTTTMTTDFFILDLQKCMAMMAEFEQKEQELSKGIEEFEEKQAEKMHKQCEKIDKMMKAAEEMSQKVEKRLEQSRKFRENFEH